MLMKVRVSRELLEKAAALEVLEQFNIDFIHNLNLKRGR